MSLQNHYKVAQRTGLEPATLGVTGRYSNQLNYRCTKVLNVKAWWALTGSNRRHSACKADALPTELSALHDFIVCVVHYRESMQPVKRFSACFHFFMFE